MKTKKINLIGVALLTIIGLGVYRAFAAPSNPTGCYTVKSQECVDRTQMGEGYYCQGANSGGSVNVLVDPTIPDGNQMGSQCGTEMYWGAPKGGCGQFEAGTQCN